MVEPLRDSTARFERGKAVVILLASSLKARLCVRTFVVCWLVSTVGRKEGRKVNKNELFKSRSEKTFLPNYLL